uniref:Uncharacterized protein n=1 Tax=Globodera rostochiensis TaxID=31243 RepID=A0A914I9X0_GLORO
MLILVVFGQEASCEPFDCDGPLGLSKDCVDNCQLAMRHRGSVPGLEKYTKKMKVQNFVEGNNLHQTDCLDDLTGCMTFKCIDGDGNDIFRFNSCEDKNNRCSKDHELDKICRDAGAKPICNYCLNVNGGNCNKDSIELDALLPKTTPPPPPPPTPPPFKPPHIVLEASIEKGGGVMSLCNFTFTFLLFLGGVLVRWMMEM